MMAGLDGAAAPPAVADDRLALGGSMIGRLRRAPDPFWEDGKGARRTRRRRRAEAFIALTIAIAACGLTIAMWLRTLAPFAERFGLG